MERLNWLTREGPWSVPQSAVERATWDLDMAHLRCARKSLTSCSLGQFSLQIKGNSNFFRPCIIDIRDFL